MKHVCRAWGHLKRVFEVLALGEMCFQGTREVAKGRSEVLTLDEMYFTGMGGVEKVVRGVGTR